MGNIEKGKTAESEKTGRKAAFHISKEPVVQGRPEENVHKYEATIGESPVSGSGVPAFEDLGPLPASYGSKSLFLVARDPQWLFCYWDVDWSEYPPSRMRDGRVLLKVYDAGTGGEVYSTEVSPDARNWYISAGRGNAAFYSELGFVNEGGEWEVITRSNETRTPSDAISEQVTDTFATVPYHLAFQKMLDLVAPSMHEGESLLSVLARIQGEGHRLAFVLGQVPEWTAEQRRVLASLLGTDLDQMLSLDTEEIDRLLRQQLQERLFSESASGLLPMGIEVGGASLSSALAFGFMAGIVACGGCSGRDQFLVEFVAGRSRSGCVRIVAGIVARRGGKPCHQFLAGILAGGGSVQQRDEFVAGVVARGAKRKLEFLAGVVAGSGAERVLEFLADLMERGGRRFGNVPEFVAQFLAIGGKGRDVLEFLAHLLGWSRVRVVGFLVIPEFLALLVAGGQGRGIELLEFVAEFVVRGVERRFGSVQFRAGCQLECAAFWQTERILHARQRRGHLLRRHASRCTRLDRR